jgi:hypothetical protein
MTVEQCVAQQEAALGRQRYEAEMHVIRTARNEALIAKLARVLGWSRA